MATLNIPTTEAKTLLKFREVPTEWVGRQKPIRHRLPAHNGAYHKDTRTSNVIPRVLADGSSGPYQCKISFSNDGTILTMDGGIVVWPVGSAILPRTTIKIPQVRLLDGLYSAGYILDNPQQHFIDDINPSIEAFHIMLGQIQVRGSRIIAVTDLRNFTTDREDPVAHWVTSFQDEMLETLRNDIVNFNQKYMNPFTAGYYIYEQLNLNQQEIDNYENHNQIPSKLTQTQRITLENVRKTLNWTGQLLGFNDTSHLSLAETLFEKRLLMAGVFGQYGLPGRKQTNLNPTRYDLAFHTQIVPLGQNLASNSGANSSGQIKKRLQLQTESLAQTNSHLNYSETDPIVLFVGGLYSFDKPITVLNTNLEINSDYLLFNNNKSLQVLRASSNLIDLGLANNAAIIPTKVRFHNNNFNDRSAEHRGLWGPKGSKYPQNYCLDSLGLVGFEEDYGIDFKPHKYTVTPEELVKLAGLRPNNNTRKFFQYKFQLNNGPTGETSKPTQSVPRSLDLINTAETLEDTQSLNDAPAGVTLTQKNDATTIEKFDLNYTYAGKNSLTDIPRLEWLLDPSLDNGEYDPSDSNRENLWIDVDEGDVSKVQSDLAGVTFDESEYRYKSVQPFCPPPGTPPNKQEIYDGGTFYHTLDSTKASHGIDGGLSNHIPLNSNSDDDSYEEVANIETATDLDSGFYEFEPYVTIDNGEAVEYPAIYHGTNEDPTDSFKYRIHDNYDGKGGYYFEVLIGGKITAAIGNAFIEIKIPPTESPPAGQKFPVPYLGMYLHTLGITGKVIVGIKDYSIQFKRGGSPDNDKDNNDFEKDRNSQYTWATENLNYSNGENKRVYELAVYTDQTRPAYALDLAEIELIPVAENPSERRAKNLYQKDITDLRRFTTHNRYDSSDNTDLDTGGPTLDGGVYNPAAGEEPDSSYDEGLSGGSRREGIPYVPPTDTQIEPVKSCPSEPIRVPVPAFTGLQWRVKPDSRHTTVLPRIWSDSQAVTGNLAADNNQGTHQKHQYRHFLRLPPSVKRGSEKWDKALRTSELFSSFSSTVSDMIISKSQEQPTPNLYQENLKQTNLSHNNILYDEPFLISKIQNSVPLAPTYSDGSIRNEETGEGQWTNSQVSEYDPIQTRKNHRDPLTDEYAGQYFTTDGKTNLSGIRNKDISEGKITPVKVPQWERPSPTVFQTSLTKDKLKNYGICYAYFGADLSAAEEPVFDPDNPVCWATNSKNQVPTAYL